MYPCGLGAARGQAMMGSAARRLAMNFGGVARRSDIHFAARGTPVPIPPLGERK